MQRIDSKEVRKRQLDLFEKFDSFCKTNNIKYFVAYGTLLGAIRHKGFIPWDNDIDCWISREDYLKLQKILESDDSNDDFRLLCFENDLEYLWPHGRISDKHTYIKTAGGYKKFGISIDLFPLDSQGNDYNKAKKIIKKIHECVALRVMAYDKKYKKFRLPKGSTTKKLKLLLKFALPSHQTEKYWVEKNLKLLEYFNDDTSNSKYYGCNALERTYAIFERDLFSKTVYFDFEGMKVPAPIGYDTILRTHYGDYMKLPPEEQRTKIDNTVVYKI